MTREMKNSGVEWIGNIPSEWKIIKSKYIFANHKEIVGDRENNFERLSLTLNGVLKRPKDDSKGLQSESLSTYQVLYKDELVFKMIDLENTSTSRVGYSPYTGLVSPVYIVFNNNKYSKYGFWYFYNLWQRNIYNTLGNNGVRSALNASDMLNLPFIQIPNEEQTRISDFLDSKVTEIDKIISETRASIENYKGYKQSVITEAVTKGLDKNVPMKDSGIKWIGEIPVDWRLGKIKSCVKKVGSGKTPKGGGDVYSSEGVLFLRSQNVYDTGLVLDDPTYISEEIDEEMKNTRVMDKDVLLNITGGSIGRCCIYDKSYGKANVNQHVSIIRLKQDIMFPEYMHYYWLSSLGKMSVNLYQTGGNREGMSADAIKNSPIIYTSISTQKEIIAFLDSKCAEIDNIILEKEKLITNLEEYKKSLIYEYVTGKKPV